MRQSEKTGGLIIDVARLNRAGERFCGEIDADVLQYSKDDIFFQPLSGLRYDLLVQLLSGELLVRGSVSERFRCMCVRCASDFIWETSENEVIFSLEAEQEDFIDITEELREAIVLTFPSNPLCRPDCRGLCRHCGVDLNESTCSCKEPGSLASQAFDGLI